MLHSGLIITNLEAIKIKLTPSLVPEGNWYINMRHHLGDEWKKLSRKIREINHYECSICGAKPDKRYLHAHEVWEFYDRKDQGLQKLADIISVCKDCHDVIHWGRTSALESQERVEYLINHFCKVNNARIEDFERELGIAVQKWHRRSKRDYPVDMSKGIEIYNNLIGAD